MPKHRSSRSTKIDSKQLLLDFMADTQGQGKQVINAYSAMDKYAQRLEQRKKLPIYQVCPRYSVLEHVVDITVAETDLPPSLTYHAAITLLGAALAQENFIATFPDGKRMSPNLWTLALAPSGAGKTWTIDNIAEPVIASQATLETLPETFTAAAMFEYFATTGLSPNVEQNMDLYEIERVKGRRAKALLIRDEAGEWIRNINKQEIYAELKDMLLRAYDNKELKRSTKRDGERETGPVAMSFYGTSVDTTFFSSLKESDFLNGFFQRFLLVLAHDRPKERVSWYTTYGKEDSIQNFKKVWERAIAGTRDYKVSKSAFEVFNKWFHDHFNYEQESYFRRYLYSAFKYALILKVITEPNGEIDAPIMDMALNIVDRHLADLYKIMKDFTHFNEWAALVSKVEKCILDNPNIDRSTLHKSVRGISTAQTLDVILEVIADRKSSLEVVQRATRLLTSRRRS